MIEFDDIIVAPATAYGIGSINILRVSGNGSLELCIKILNKKDIKPRYATLCKVSSINGDFLDECIVLYFKAPYSYTGEDVVEIHSHGGFVISSLIQDEIIKLGARLAKPGEFSKRAFLNDKMDLAKAESIQALINARSSDAAKILARSLNGELSDYVNLLRSELIKNLAFVEACIDYAEDDLPQDILENTQKMLDENIKKLSDIVNISERRSGLIDGFKVAIIGKPNVGKSSILNSLLKFDRAIVSDIAGTTRDTIEENIKISTHLVRIIDTAGIRENAQEIESIGIDYSIKAANDADIIIAVFDGNKPSNDEDKRILDLCHCLPDKKVFYVLNKSDLEFKFDIFIENVIKISAKKSTEEIIKNLKDYLDSQNYSGLMLSSDRQIVACRNANSYLQSAKVHLNNGVLEFFAFEINRAINSIASITKTYDKEEMLDEMFANFCLGK